jgi:membrane-associated phospholipid phosphatase
VPETASPAVPDLHPRLTLDLPTQAWWTGSLLAVAGVTQLLSDRLAPPACRWCEPPQLDRWARRELRWNDPKGATAIGNALIVVVPVGAALTLGLMAHADGAGLREGTEDLLVMTEATAVTLVLMQAAKFGVARLRPDAWAGSGSTTANSRMSFFAGHASTAFAVAASATQVARLRGRPGWGWFAAAAFTGAAATGFFRIASDNHWLTDVVTGAAIGTAVGLGLPSLVLHEATPGFSGITLAPAPGGLAIHF